MKGEDIKTSLLITNEERAAKLDSLLSYRFTERGKLQLPTLDQYNSLQTNAGLTTLLKTHCRWFGTKPTHLHAQFSEQPYPAKDVSYSDGVVTIAAQYMQHPYMTGALVAEGALLYFFDRHGESNPDMTLVEFATIYTGLGLWVLNGLSPHARRHHRLYHLIGGTADVNKTFTLVGYKPGQYAQNLADYAHNNRVLPETYVPHVSASARKLLPDYATSRTQRVMVEPDVVLGHRKTANSFWIKLALVSLTTALVVVIGLFLWQTTREPISLEQIRDQQSLKTIKQAHEACIAEASDQQSKYDPNDIFLAQKIDATKTRCESLRNQYNYALTQYETSYQK